MNDTASKIYELHLDLGTIQGESQSKLHYQEIEIDSYSWGVSNAAIRSTKDGGSTKGGKATVSEIIVTKRVDKASAALFKACTEGTRIKIAKISQSKSTGGGKTEDYMVITLTGVYITSAQMSQDRETATLNFETVSIDYKTQLGSGLLASAASAAYNLLKGL